MDPSFLGPLVPIAAIIAFAAVKIVKLRASAAPASLSRCGTQLAWRLRSGGLPVCGGNSKSSLTRRWWHITPAPM